MTVTRDEAPGEEGGLRVHDDPSRPPAGDKRSRPLPPRWQPSGPRADS